MKLWTVSFVGPNLQLESICDQNNMANFSTEFQSGKNVSNISED